MIFHPESIVHGNMDRAFGESASGSRRERGRKTSLSFASSAAAVATEVIKFLKLASSPPLLPSPTSSFVASSEFSLELTLIFRFADKRRMDGRVVVCPPLFLHLSFAPSFPFEPATSANMRANTG